MTNFCVWNIQVFSLFMQVKLIKISYIGTLLKLRLTGTQYCGLLVHSIVVYWYIVLWFTGTQYCGLLVHSIPVYWYTVLWFTGTQYCGLLVHSIVVYWYTVL